MQLALATCLEMPEPDEDRDLLSDAFAEAGIAAEWLAWDDPAAPFSAAPITLLRSTWNYVHHRDHFLEWADALGPGRLINPPAVVRWNTHKRYLRQLEAEGFPTVPTVLIPRGSRVRLPAIQAAKLLEADWTQGGGRLVAKPAVGAGSFATRVLDGTAEDQAFWDEAVETRDMLLQPFLPTVESSGERALVYVGGRFTHAVQKSPRFAGDAEDVSSTSVEMAEDELELSRKLLRWVERELPAGALVYARVDLIRSCDDRPLVMELELVEPSLFLGRSPEATELLVAAVRDRVHAAAFRRTRPGNPPALA